MHNKKRQKISAHLPALGSNEGQRKKKATVGQGSSQGPSGTLQGRRHPRQFGVQETKAQMARNCEDGESRLGNSHGLNELGKNAVCTGPKRRQRVTISS